MSITGSKLKIGIVGCGAIGSSLAKEIIRRFGRDAVLSALYDADIARARKLSRLILKRDNLSAGSLEQLIERSDLVIECASGAAAWEIAMQTIERGRDIMIMSVGGIISHFKQLFGLAKKYNRRVYIPSGAICGIDALKAAKISRIKKITLTTRKNPVAFKGVKFIEEKGINPDNIKEDKILFLGSACEAVKYFPQNINVAAILSLAGIGAKKTRVRIIASPSVKMNIHEIEIDSDSGKIFTRAENILHPSNPKTSFLAVLSAVATLKQILNPVKIGT